MWSGGARQRRWCRAGPSVWLLVNLARSVLMPAGLASAQDLPTPTAPTMPTPIPTPSPAANGQEGQQIAPVYIISAIAVVLAILLLLCLCGQYISRRRKRRQTESAFRTLQEPDPSLCAEVIESWSNDGRRQYEMARDFFVSYPPRRSRRVLDMAEAQRVREDGVAAWRIMLPAPSDRGTQVRSSDPAQLDVFVAHGSDITYSWRALPPSPARHQELPILPKTGTPLLLQSNLPVPRVREIYYFEVKLAEKPTDTEVGIGVASKPYPDWRMPGQHTFSAGYMANSGLLYANNPFEGREYGGPFFEGDVVGVCINTRTGAIFFTRNGVQLETAAIGMTFDLYPTVSANGPCSLEVNFGQAAYVYIEANVHQWGFAPVLESSERAPPAYGSEQGSILLEMAPSSSVQATGTVGSTGSSFLRQHQLLANSAGQSAVPASASSVGSTVRTVQYLPSHGGLTPDSIYTSPVRDSLRILSDSMTTAVGVGREQRRSYPATESSPANSRPTSPVVLALSPTLTGGIDEDDEAPIETLPPPPPYTQHSPSEPSSLAIAASQSSTTIPSITITESNPV